LSRRHFLDATRSRPDPFVLTGAKIQNGAFQAGFTNILGGTSSVLTATNLSLPAGNWTMPGAVTDNPPSQFSFTDPPATNRPQRFYRVSAP
jgi:hypothetical protein